MYQELFVRNMIALCTLLLFGVILWSRRTFRNMETRYFWLTVISCLILICEDALETLASGSPSLLYWRIFFSATGYSFRSIASLSLLLVIVPHRKKPYLLWIPSMITILISLSAFFTDWAFGFDDNYIFYRGPLGYVAFVVPILYMLMIIWVTHKRIAERKGLEKLIVPLCVIFCLAATTADVTGGGVRLNEAIIISSIFFYIFLYSHDNRLDPLTGLLNRQAFYEDCAQYGREVSAVASIDMNGLKELNDSKGHHEGDEALSNIGKCLLKFADGSTHAYRIGGDEFVILFFGKSDEFMERCDRIRTETEKKGCRVSVGYAIRDDEKELERLIRESDKMMYEDKARFYSESGRKPR